MGISQPVDAGAHARARRALLILSLAVSTPALATASTDQPVQEIVVVGNRERLMLAVERELNQDDVAAYGLGSIGELLDELRRERGSGDDDILVLVDGKRIAATADIEDYPVEAIERVQVSPIGAGTRAGASPSQRVYNILLKPSVRTIVGRAGGTLATEGGAASGTAELGSTSIRKPRRSNIMLRQRHDAALLESEREIIQSPGSPGGLGRSRALRPELNQSELTFNLADEWGEALTASLTARLTRSRSEARQGLSTDGETLFQRGRQRGAFVSLTLNREVGPWLMTMTGVGRTDRRTIVTDLEGETVQSPARTREAEIGLSAVGPLVALPAGDLTLSLRSNIRRQTIGGGSERFSLTNREVGAGLNLPVSNGGSGLGEITAGVDFDWNRVSRIGALTAISGSLQWQPARWIRLSGLVTSGRTPPSFDLLGAPLIATPGVRTIDPMNGQTVEVVELTGGNPALGAQRNRSSQLSVTLRPLPSRQISLTGDYLSTRQRDIVAVLPPASALLLQSFPDRFVRDVAGNLIQVDSRPVSFSRMEDARLRLGLNAVLPLGGSGAVADRLQFNLSHNWQLYSRVTIRDGFAAIDLLDPDQTLLTGLGRPRHEFEASAGYARRGLGLWVLMSRRGESYAQLGIDGTDGLLRFAPITKVGVRAFAEVRQFFPGADWLKGSRVTLSVDNLTNRRQRVSDGLGNVPLRYQPAYQDPIGRTVQLELRASF